MSSGFDDTLTNLARPRTSAIITIRVIKSLEFRTERSLVLRDINLETTTVGGLKETTTNLIINLDHDEWILSDEGRPLSDCGLENETEVSFFNREMYETSSQTLR
ncbi:hypothetical protein BC826DRAFT_1092533 [Russula brevipes]|nr:hypothetical protein BC826DRAFT_1092533 [Russula brevipes]